LTGNIAVCPYCNSTIRLPNATEQLQEKLLNERAARAERQSEQTNSDLEDILGMAAKRLMSGGFFGGFRTSARRFFRRFFMIAACLIILVAIAVLIYSRF
jgi:hypothetical protein